MIGATHRAAGGFATPVSFSTCSSKLNHGIAPPHRNTGPGHLGFTWKRPGRGSIDSILLLKRRSTIPDECASAPTEGYSAAPLISRAHFAAVCVAKSANGGGRRPSRAPRICRRRDVAESRACPILACPRPKRSQLSLAHAENRARAERWSAPLTEPSA